VWQRFARADKRSKLPRWINQYITEPNANLSTDMALVQSKLFMRTISQNPNENQTGISLWTLEDVERAQQKQRDLLELNGGAEHRDDAMDEDAEFGDGGMDDDALAAVDLQV
jgi:DNA excision repair protein ERCC-2